MVQTTDQVQFFNWELHSVKRRILKRIELYIPFDGRCAAIPFNRFIFPTLYRQLARGFTILRKTRKKRKSRAIHSTDNPTEWRVTTVGDVAELHRFHQKYFVADGRIMKLSIQFNLRIALAGSWILLATACPGVGQDPVATTAPSFATAGFVRLPSFPKPGAEKVTSQVVRPASSFTLTPLPSLMLPSPSGGTVAPASGTSSQAIRMITQEGPEASEQSTDPKPPNSTSAKGPGSANKTSGSKTVGSDAPLELLSLDGIRNLNHPVNPTEIFQRFDLSRVVKNPESVALLLKETSGEAIPSSQDARDYGLWSDASVLWDSPAFCHNPLYFEQVNLERYGIGYNRPVNAIVSGSRFFIDASLLPIRMVQTPHKSCVCTLGYLRPGNCNPTYKSHP